MARVLNFARVQRSDDVGYRWRRSESDATTEIGKSAAKVQKASESGQRGGANENK